MSLSKLFETALNTQNSKMQGNLWKFCVQIMTYISSTSLLYF
jgi:hypothetical protein